MRLTAAKYVGSIAMPPWCGRLFRARRSISFLALASVLVSGCVPDLGPKPIAATLPGFASTHSLAAPPTAWPDDNWWRFYEDPQLDALEDEALASAPDLRAAEARMRKAAAAAQEIGAATQPTVAANGNAGAIKDTIYQGFPSDYYLILPHGVHSQGQLTLNFAWDLDFFGRNRAALAAATSNAQAAAIDAAAARLHLSTAVAAVYADLLRLFKDHAAAVDALRVRKSTLQLVSQRFDQGLATRVERSQQATTVPIAEGDLDAIDRQILVDRHRIAALIGAGPDRGLSIVPPRDPTLRPFGVPATLRLDLVGRRPDLVAARLRTQAAGHQLDSAKAAFYPDVNLVAFAGVSSFGISDLFTKNATVGQAGPAISLPIFSGGRLEGTYRGARADYDESIANYDGLLTDALRDIADILGSERSLHDQLEASQRALASATDAYNGMKLRYAAGLTPYLDVLTAETTLISQRRDVADLQAQFLTLDIDLVHALGGGFAAPQYASK